MFRLASYKNNLLTDLEAQVTIAIRDSVADGGALKFYPAPLEISRIANLALNWTIVHSITDESPLAGLTEQDFRERHIEVVVSIKAFDDHFATTVQQRTSYAGDEIVYGAKFLSMFHRAENGIQTVIELDKMDAFEPAQLPVIEEPATGAVQAGV